MYWRGWGIQVSLVLLFFYRNLLPQCPNRIPYNTGVWELAPEVYHAIYCKVVKHPGVGMCKGYRELPLGLLLNRLGVKVPGIGSGEQREVVGEVVEMTEKGIELAVVAGAG